MRALGRISYHSAAPRGGANWTKGTREATRGVVETQKVGAGVCCRWGAEAQLISRRDRSSRLRRAPGSSSPGCSQGCRVMARQPGWQGNESVKPTTKMSVLEITGPLLGGQKPPSGC